MKCLVFAPGIMGTVLENSARETVWPPTVLEFITGYRRIKKLLDRNLVPVYPIKTVGPMAVYETLLNDIAVCGYSQGSTNRLFLPFPYDWRKSNKESAQALVDLLDTTFPQVPQDLEITFLAHSMGGLVMRYILESDLYTSHPWFSKIKRLITMGTPQFGASLALFHLRGSENYVGLSGPDLKTLADTDNYSSAYELVPPATTALTVRKGLPGELPEAMDPFDSQIQAKLGMNRRNVRLAQDFWSKLNIEGRPSHVEYFFFVGSSLRTNIRNEWIGPTRDPLPIERKASGDGTVPIASSISAGIPHAFSQKKHLTIFTDRQVRESLYRILEAPSHVHPQAAGGGPPVGSPDAIGLSVNKESYTPGEDIEVVVSFNRAMTNPRETFELVAIDPKSGQRKPGFQAVYINAELSGISISEFSFTIAKDLEPGLYQLGCMTHVSDDPEPTTFFVQEA